MNGCCLAGDGWWSMLITSGHGCIRWPRSTDATLGGSGDISGNVW
jgi:hypothetical protein